MSILSAGKIKKIIKEVYSDICIPHKWVEIQQILDESKTNKLITYKCSKCERTVIEIEKV